MKQFDIFEDENGNRDAVKEGFSWPGFFFKWVWAFVKGMPGYGLLFLGTATLALIIDQLSGAQHALPVLSGLSFSLWVGLEGNEWRRKNLLARGYQWIGTVEAESPAAALMAANNREAASSELTAGPSDELSAGSARAG
jgi:hypothetical protein